MLSLFFTLFGCQPTTDAPETSNNVKQLSTADLGSSVTLKSVVVSSPVLPYGFFVSDPVAGPQSGIWVYTEQEAAVEYGDQISLSGLFEEYTHASSGWSTKQIALDQITETYAHKVHVEPHRISPDALLEEGASSLLSTLVQLDDVEITDPDLGDGGWEIDEVVVMDDLFFQPEPLVAENTFASVSGILISHNGALKMAPRGASDLKGHEQSCAGDRCAWELAYGELVIQEVMPNPHNDGSCADSDGEYIELRYIPHDAFAGSIDLAGLIVADANKRYQIKHSVEVFANQIIWLSMGDGSCYGSPVMHMGNRITLNNSGDTISVLVQPPLAAEKLIDDMQYEEDQVVEGVALQLAGDHTTADGNDSFEAWCAARTSIEDSHDLGSPGRENHSCK